jgi:hypothetical protein
MSAAPSFPQRQSERDFQRAFLDYAHRLGWRTAHWHDSRREVTRASGKPLVIGDKDSTGFPDIVAARKGRLLFAELKSEKGRLSVAQKDWLADLEEVESYWWDRERVPPIMVRTYRPSDWSQIERDLR